MFFNFFSKKKEGRELSNFYEGVIVLEERTYGSGEAAFHGTKYMKVGDTMDDPTRKQELYEYAKKFELGQEFSSLPENEIKKRGGKGKHGMKLGVNEIKKWEELCLDVQREICKYKYENDDDVRRVLNSTIGKVLIHPAMRCNREKVKSRLWEGRGEICDGNLVVLGGNMLGNIWMEIRDSN
tara:strand:- start:242 stop:787 length:546 start_codon:yes stop_codon:yes gene_type:complete